MTTPRIVALADVPPTAWKNGGGVTRELLAWPPGDDWQVRISVAEITADGPFSSFPGVARWFSVLEAAASPSRSTASSGSVGAATHRLRSRGPRRSTAGCSPARAATST